MTETLYGEIANVADETAEFTVYDDNNNKQCYARYPVNDLPADAEPGDVFTVKVDETDQEIVSLESNPEKTEEFKQQREDVVDKLS